MPPASRMSERHTNTGTGSHPWVVAFPPTSPLMSIGLASIGRGTYLLHLDMPAAHQNKQKRDGLPAMCLANKRRQPDWWPSRLTHPSVGKLLWRSTTQGDEPPSLWFCRRNGVAITQVGVHNAGCQSRTIPVKLTLSHVC